MRRTLFLLIVGLGGAAVLVALGIWQVQRLAWKEAIIADIDARIAATPVELPATPDPQAHAYLPVTLTGRIVGDPLHVLVSQKQVGAGYRVIAPFEAQTGDTLMVDLGFLPTSAKDTALPDGLLTVTGNLQWPRETDNFTPDPDRDRNIWFARDVPAMATALQTRPVLVVARQVDPTLPGIDALPVDTAAIPNDHMQYAITWFSLAALWLAMTVAFLRRRRPSVSES